MFFNFILGKKYDIVFFFKFNYIHFYLKYDFRLKKLFVYSFVIKIKIK